LAQGNSYSVPVKPDADRSGTSYSLFRARRNHLPTNNINGIGPRQDKPIGRPPNYRSPIRRDPRHIQKLPYIATIHCYGVTTDERVVAYSRTCDLRAKTEDEAAPRYQIDFRGLSAYRGLTDPMKRDIRSIIDGSKNALFNNHPRKDGLDFVRQMLPLLNAHPSAMAWFKEEFQQGNNPRIGAKKGGGKQSNPTRE
jgi:hypothetical protein